MQGANENSRVVFGRAPLVDCMVVVWWLYGGTKGWARAAVRVVDLPLEVRELLVLGDAWGDNSVSIFSRLYGGTMVVLKTSSSLFPGVITR